MNIHKMSNAELDRLAIARDRMKLFTLYADLDVTASKSWLVDKMLGTGEMSAWYGAPGCGKGVIIEDLGLHVAAGRDWHRPDGAGLAASLLRKRQRAGPRRRSTPPRPAPGFRGTRTTGYLT